jgi:2-phospho-L-lactate guanylyltransferase
VRIVAVIPVKRASQGKQRLAGVLDPATRRQLVTVMLEHVLQAVAAAQGLAGVRVLTSDRALVPAGIERIPDPGAGLNAALAAAARILAGQEADAMLVLPADIPFVTTPDVEALLLLARPRRVVVVPDTRGVGTNALLLAPPRALEPQFGPASFAAHRESAAAAGADCIVRCCANIGRDIDEPGDLAQLLDEAPARFGFVRFTREASCNEPGWYGELRSAPR